MDQYPEITFEIENKFKKLIIDKITPWIFLNARKMPPIENFYGQVIRYGEQKFEGSPREVFWSGFIEPFLENIFIWAFKLALDYAEKHHSDTRELILYTHDCLANGVRLIYGKMQQVDRNLRGGGFPDRVTLRDVTREINQMDLTLDRYRDSTLEALRIRKKNVSRDNFSDIIELKPGIWGVSFDLKKFWRRCIAKFNHSQQFDFCRMIKAKLRIFATKIIVGLIIIIAIIFGVFRSEVSAIVTSFWGWKNIKESRRKSNNERALATESLILELKQNKDWVHSFINHVEVGDHLGKKEINGARVSWDWNSPQLTAYEKYLAIACNGDKKLAIKIMNLYTHLRSCNTMVHFIHELAINNPDKKLMIIEETAEYNKRIYDQCVGMRNDFDDPINELQLKIQHVDS